MRYVTYDAGAGPRVGALDGGGVVDVGFDGDMVAFIEAGAPIAAERPVPDARLLAPLVPRSFRDFLAFEGHLRNAYRNLGRDVPTEWYEVPVYYRSMGTTVIGPDTVSPSSSTVQAPQTPMPQVARTDRTPARRSASSSISPGSE